MANDNDSSTGKGANMALNVSIFICKNVTYFYSSQTHADHKGSAEGKKNPL